MIQRIQTVFLLLAIVALALFVWFPLITVTTGTMHEVFKGYEIGHKVPLSSGVYIILITLILSGTAAGLSLINIFLYNKRKVQMTVCWLSIMFIVSAVSFVYYRYMTIHSRYDSFAHKIVESDVYFTPWNIAALAAIVLQILAFIYIRKDENLIKSMDRLR